VHRGSLRAPLSRSIFGRLLPSTEDPHSGIFGADDQETIAHKQMGALLARAILTPDGQVSLRIASPMGKSSEVGRPGAGLYRCARHPDAGRRARICRPPLRFATWDEMSIRPPPDARHILVNGVR